jgi:hypothetical protein
MNLFLFHFRAFGAGFALAAISVVSYAAVPTPSPTFQQRIDALLKQRLRPEPLPIDPPNPFQLITGGVRDVSLEGAAVKPATKPSSEPNGDQVAAYTSGDVGGASSAEVLAGCVARLKIGGMIRIRDQIQIVVNDIPRKEGDVIVVDWNKSSIHLRVVNIQPSQLTLRYGDADVILKY